MCIPSCALRTEEAHGPPSSRSPQDSREAWRPALGPPTLAVARGPQGTDRSVADQSPLQNRCSAEAHGRRQGIKIRHLATGHMLAATAP